MCECGRQETVKNVLLDCGRWRVERQELKGITGKSTGSQ